MPAIQCNPVYPAGLVLLSVISPLRGPPDKTLFVSRRILAADACVAG
jgi:hypothetical protein